MALHNATEKTETVEVSYRQYNGEEDLKLVMQLVDNELSEPYSVFTYRYFLQNWPNLCFISMDGSHHFGTVICKMDMHGSHMRGYVAMLVVEKKYRKLGVGSELVKRAISAMIEASCDEVVLEAEVTNYGALNLYQNLGFIRDKRLHRYYLNGADAYRLKLLLPLTEEKLLELQRQHEQQSSAAAAVSNEDAELRELAARAAQLGISKHKAVAAASPA